MSSIMCRSFAECLGVRWPPDLAMLVNGQPVTWDEVHACRRDRQRERLSWKRAIEPRLIRPCYIWVFYVPSWLYAGWHCYLVSRRDSWPVSWATHGRWSTLEGPALAASIMRAVPLGLLPFAENWETWMEVFAERYPRKHPSDPRKAGSIVGWIKGKRDFSLTKPTGD